MSNTPEAGDFIPWTTEDANKASAQQLSEYISNRINDYDDEKIGGSLLHEYFVHDFQNFNETIFRKIPNLKSLRDYLRSHDVFVEKRRGTKMAPALFKTCTSEYMPLPSGEQIEVLPQFKSQQTFTTSQSPSQTQPALQQHYQRSDEDKKTTALINLNKICKDNQKYRGSPDEFFDIKFATFAENCKTVGLPGTRHHEAFHIMLEGPALQHYRTIVSQNNMIIPSISILTTEIKHFFEGKERESMLRSQWNEISLFSVLAEQPETQKDVEKALTVLVQNLRHLQQGLSASYRSEEIFYGKLIDSCKGHPATNIACSTTPTGDTSIDFINRAKANISTWRTSQALAKNPQYQQFFESEDKQEDTFYTDRRFQGSFNKRLRGPQDSYQSRNLENQRKNFNRTRRTCYVCRKENCWSTRHTEEERQQARKRLKNAYHRQNHSYISDAEFDERFDAFVSEIEASIHDDDFVEQLAATTINDSDDIEHFLLAPGENHQL